MKKRAITANHYFFNELYLFYHISVVNPNIDDLPVYNLKKGIICKFLKVKIKKKFNLASKYQIPECKIYLLL